MWRGVILIKIFRHSFPLNQLHSSGSFYLHFFANPALRSRKRFTKSPACLSLEIPLIYRPLVFVIPRKMHPTSFHSALVQFTEATKLQRDVLIVSQIRVQSFLVTTFDTLRTVSVNAAHRRNSSPFYLVTQFRSRFSRCCRSSHFYPLNSKVKRRARMFCQSAGRERGCRVKGASPNV